MEAEVNVKTVISCIELLINQDKNIERKSLSIIANEDLFSTHLEQNVKKVIEFLSKQPNLNDILKLYKLSESRKPHAVCWDFVLLCLLLLKSLSETLINQDIDDNKSPSNETSPPKGILSINQEHIIKKCFEFIIALGILPNLIQSIQNLLERRASMFKDVKNIHLTDCPKKQYYRLLIIILILIDCLKQKCLQRIFFMHYSGDLLIALLQLCYAPLKKIKNEPKSLNSSTDHLKIGVANVAFNKNGSYNLSDILRKIEENVPDEKMLCEMIADRKYFMQIMSYVISQIPPPALTWNLLLFQGFGGVQDTQMPRGNKNKMPIWFKNVCMQIITEQIMSPFGVRNFIAVVLDKTVDEDITSGKISNEKVDALAKLIVLNNIKHLHVNVYLKEVCTQAFQLLHIHKTPMDNIFKCIVSSIILHIIEFHNESLEGFISHILFKPFIEVLDNSSTSCANHSEEDINQCIENIHLIFVNTVPVLSQEVVYLLLPYFHLLFIMYVKLSKGILVVKKTKVEELLLAILNNSTDDSAVELLRFITFEDRDVPSVRSASHLIVDFGGEIVVNNQNELNTEDLVKNSEEKCDALFSLIQKVGNRKIKFTYFSLLLKKSSFRKMDDGDPSIKDVWLSNLLEKFLEQVDDIMDDFDQSVDLISDIVSSDTFAGSTLSEVNEKVLVILSAILQFNKQLTYDHWTTLKKCLPSLKKLMNSNMETASIAQDIFVTIQTHGAVMDSNPRNKNLSPYASAIQNIKDPCVAIKGGGLLSLCRFLEKRDEETVGHITDVLNIFKENLFNDDSYVYLSAIRGLSIIADIDVQLVLPILLSEIENTDINKIEQLLKIGEVFVKICQNLGDLTVKYRNLLLNIFLKGTKHDDPLVRASSLSNLGELCQKLKFSIGPFLQEVLNCITSLLKYDSSIEVRRSAALALRLMVQGCGIHSFEILESSIKEVYSVLNHICRTEKDAQVIIHCQLAVDEINNMMKDKFLSMQTLQKEIRICDAFE